MVFSWPSKAGFLDYAYDRESAVWSRDAFERVLTAAMANPNIGRIHIVAHSMGTLLALESLRQVYGRYGEAGADRIGAIIFASPDIDLDVFASSVARLGPLAQKITVITASNDRALALAGRVAGGVTRVGAADREALSQLGLRVVDASALGFGIVNHDLFLSNGEVRRVIRRAVKGAVAGVEARARPSLYRSLRAPCKASASPFHPNTRGRIIARSVELWERTSLRTSRQSVRCTI